MTDTSAVIIKVNEKYYAIDTELNTYVEIIRATREEEGKWFDMIVKGEIVPEHTCFGCPQFGDNGCEQSTAEDPFDIHSVESSAWRLVEGAKACHRTKDPIWIGYLKRESWYQLRYAFRTWWRIRFGRKAWKQLDTKQS